MESAPEGDWNNPFDPAGTNYHPPTIGLGDTAIRDGASGVVLADARSPVSTIARCDWTLDGIAQASAACSLPTAGWSPGNHVVTISATDATGLAGPTSTVNVWIGNQPPRLEPIADARVAASAGVWRELAATDPDGTTASVSWDTVPGRYSIVSESVHLDPHPEGGIRTVYWRARDDEGDVSASSFTVGFVPAPEPAIRMHYNGTGTMVGSEWHWSISMRDKAVFEVEVEVPTIPGFPDEPITLSVSSVAGDLPCRRWNSLLSGPESFTCAEKSVTSWSNSQIVALATNRYGESSQTSIQVSRRIQF